MANELTLVIEAKDEASRVLQNVDKQVSGLGTTLGKVGTVASGFLAADVVSKGVGFVTEQIGGALDAARESIQVNAQLEAVLKSTGGAAGVTAQQAKDLAASLQLTSKFEDEAVLTGENLLLTFTNIGGDTFPRATQSMVDMSQALGQDMKSSAIQLGKALNDPIQGITALRRVGVSFTDEQMEQIRVMQESGDIAGAQALILSELEKEFGGSAKAASDAAGAMERNKDRMNELKEEMGTKMIPVQEAWAKVQLKAVDILLKEVVPAVQKVVTTFQEYWPQIQPVLQFVYDFTKARIEGVIQVIRGWVEVISSVVNLIADIFHGRWAQAWEEMKDIATAIVSILIGEMRAYFGNIPEIIIGLMPQAVEAARNLAQSLLDTIVQLISQLPQALWDLFVLAINNIPILMEMARAAAFEFALVLFNTIITQLQLLPGKLWEILTFFVTNIWTFLPIAVEAMTVFAQSVVNAAWLILQTLFQIGVNALLGLINGYVSMTGAALGAISGLASSVVSAGWEILKTLYDKGRDAIQELINGIGSMAGGVTSAISAIVNLIPGFIKDFLGIRSPSSVMYEYGQYIIQGLINGLRSKAGELIDWLAAKVPKEIRDAAGFIFGAFRTVGGAVTRGIGTVGRALGIGGGGGGGLPNSVERWRELVSRYFPPDQVENALRIILAESGGNPFAIGGPNTNGSFDVGLFQINDIHGIPTGTRQDPESNVAAAAQIFANAGGWGPWSTAPALGLHKSGLGYVPYDNYPALLHKGERVLTAAESKELGTTAAKAAEVIRGLVQHFHGPVYLSTPDAGRGTGTFGDIAFGAANALRRSGVFVG